VGGEPTRQVDNVLASIHALSNRITRAFESRLDTEHGLSVPEWRVLLSLSGDAGLTAKDIHERWAMDKMAVSRAVRRLESHGHVERSANPDDARSYVLTITTKGARLFQKILPSADARYREILACLSKKDQTALKRILKKLIAHSEALAKRGPR
jgi:DNA-binding MarR family transcriptional regulator